VQSALPYTQNTLELHGIMNKNTRNTLKAKQGPHDLLSIPRNHQQQNSTLKSSFSSGIVHIQLPLFCVVFEGLSVLSFCTKMSHLWYWMWIHCMVVILIYGSLRQHHLSINSAPIALRIMRRVWFLCQRVCVVRRFWLHSWEALVTDPVLLWPLLRVLVGNMSSLQPVTLLFI